jgi:hypothetical protein
MFKNGCTRVTVVKRGSREQTSEFGMETSDSVPPPQKFKTQLSAGKVMLTMFWDSQRPILENSHERSTTVNSTCYSEILCNKLKPAVKPNAKDYCQKVLPCCMTMPVCTLPPALLKPIAL